MALALSALEPGLRPWAEYLIKVAQYNRIRVRVTSVRRTTQEQAALYARYLNGQSDLPAAPPGTSLHEFGRAFDVVFGQDYRGDAQAALGRLWQSWGGTWGAQQDPVHFSA